MRELDVDVQKVVFVRVVHVGKVVAAVTSEREREEKEVTASGRAVIANAAAEALRVFPPIF